MVLYACGEPMFENAGSRKSVLEDREACAVEINNSPAATAYRQNPMAHDSPIDAERAAFIAIGDLPPAVRPPRQVTPINLGYMSERHPIHTNKGGTIGSDHACLPLTFSTLWPHEGAQSRRNSL